MTDNVVPFGGITKADLSPDKVLDGAKGLDFVLVIGEGQDGEHYASSSSDVEKAVFMCQRAIHFFMKRIDEATQ